MPTMPTMPEISRAVLTTAAPWPAWVVGITSITAEVIGVVRPEPMPTITSPIRKRSGWVCSGTMMPWSMPMAMSTMPKATVLLTP